MRIRLGLEIPLINIVSAQLQLPFIGPDTYPITWMGVSPATTLWVSGPGVAVGGGARVGVGGAGVSRVASAVMFLDWIMSNPSSTRGSSVGYGITISFASHPGGEPPAWTGAPPPQAAIAATAANKKRINARRFMNTSFVTPEFCA